MGDRGNIVLVEEKGSINLYSHWGGGRLHKSLQKALKRKQRWDDGPYLARIIFCEMLMGVNDGSDAQLADEMRAETGFGISITEVHGEHVPIYVNLDGQLVAVGDNSWTFEEFVALKLPDEPDQLVEAPKRKAASKKKK